MSLPSFRHVMLSESPLLAITQVQPEGQSVPTAGWGLSSHLASHLPPSLPIAISSPSAPLGVRLSVSGELDLRFLVFHLPARPGPPETRSKDMESSEVPPSALARLESTVSILPSAESFTEEV